MKTYLAGIALIAAFSAIAALIAPGALAGNGKTKCGSVPGPAAGSKVNGGLEVDGTCVLNNVTVNGGIVVDAGSGLGFEGGSVNGGITVNQGGELDLNAVLGVGSPTGTTSNIAGGIVLNDTFDQDLWNSTISGGIKMTNPGASPAVCGNTITGGVSVNGYDSGQAAIGDPDDSIFGINCPGNTINGPITVTNAHYLFGLPTAGVEIEGNTITGPITADSSDIEIAGNTITGPVKCTNGTNQVLSTPPDLQPNNLCS